MMTFVKRKTITSHKGHAQFLAECEEENIGMIAAQPSIPSPYACSQEWSVMRWRGVPVICREVSHKRFVVFEVLEPTYHKEEQ
jgi:hypothetical protein